ncbi:MAG: tRNA epoxyqueuosine(34) reductase QueG [Bacteroidetes bacterium]|nr:tRNA epoxyqueuosine(34) reductase QueG [Bacteroidota bacterium]
MLHAKKLSEVIKNKALDLGFSACGISKAEFLKEDSLFYKDWIACNKQGNMSYLEKNIDKRLDPRKLHPGTKSILSLLYNYYPQEFQNTHSSYKISKYAYGKDYHKIIRKKLKQLLREIEATAGETNARIFVDSAPLLERRWAQKSGVGWIGKNSMLIHPEIGSYTFIGEILVDLELAYDEEIKDYCERCTACLRACPTDALDMTKPYHLDASQCISYQTIEDSEKLGFSKENDKWIFGCDICQEVCPWNRKAAVTTEAKFRISDFIKQATSEDWESLSETDFEKYFNGSPIRRAKYEGLRKNVKFVNANKKSKSL